MTKFEFEVLFKAGGSGEGGRKKKVKVTARRKGRTVARGTARRKAKTGARKAAKVNRGRARLAAAAKRRR